MLGSIPVRRQAQAAVARVDRNPWLVAALEWIRAHLPGCEHADPLSIRPGLAGHLAAQLAPVAAARPSALRQLGLTALQLWQAHAGVATQPGSRQLAVLFTDIAGFSEWTLRVGDEAAVAALRDIGAVIEPMITAGDGVLVKRLGDGLMAVHPDAGSAVRAAVAARDAVEGLDLGGHRLRLRAGVHVGRPQPLGGDYYGRDVNIAARITDAARGGEVCISSTTREHLDPDMRLRRRFGFRAKGVPGEITAYTIA
jgi:adenylate cyclase